MTQSQHVEAYMHSIGYHWDAGVGMWRHRTNVSLEASVAELMWRQTVIAKADTMRKHRRWFERLAEYADVKKDAMEEYDSYIAELDNILEATDEQ